MNKKVKISIGILISTYLLLVFLPRFQAEKSAFNDFNDLTCAFATKGSLQQIPGTNSGKWKSPKDRIDFSLKLCNMCTDNITKAQKYDNMLGYVSGIYLYNSYKSDILNTLYQKYAFEEVIDPQIMNN